MDPKIKRFLLRPLVRQQARARRNESVARALAHLEQHAEGEAAVARLREIARPDPEGHGRDVLVEDAGELAELTRALYQSGRFSTAEYVFHATMAAESVSHSRSDAGAYDRQLAPISKKLDAFRRKHGLGPFEDRRPAEAPAAYRRLNEQYMAVHEAAETSILRELGYHDLAELRDVDRAEYDRLRERGRRAAFHRDDFVPALGDLVRRYEEDAEKAAAAQAYYAATTLLGAAIEGLLLLRCLRSRSKAAVMAQALPRKVRPAASHDLPAWRFETLIEVCAKAGWLPVEHVEWGGFDHRGLAHALRYLRNLVHPARHARDRPWLEIDARQYEGAHAMYTLLRRRLEPRARRTQATA